MTSIPPFFVRADDDFRNIEECAQRIFRLDKQLPDQVFQNPPGACRFLSVIPFAQTQFWAILNAIGKIFRDDVIYVLMQRPTPREYKHWTGVYGALRFPVSTAPESYTRTLCYDPPGPRRFPGLYFSVYTIYWFGSSGIWGIYGNRDLDIAIGSIAKGCQNLDAWLELSGSSWLTEEQAKEAVHSNVVHRGDRATFVQRLFDTYKTQLV